MCSAFKLVRAAAVLSRVWMSVSELCAAAIEYSDNTAANLLLRSLGGPQGLTGYLRSLGDSVTRLDRYEPDLNSNLPGDERDTTTPAAMRDTVAKHLLGDALSSESRGRLTGWLIDNKTGANRLRAGIPANWRVGDKTGGGDRGATNDIAIVWPSGWAPVLIVIYFSDSTISSMARDSVIADVGRIVSDILTGHTQALPR